MNFKKLQNFIGLAVFTVAAAVYFMTVQPSVSFWDCGEFIASSYSMQVPHPPGTPFFIILGRIFSMIPFTENIGSRVNAISVLSSAFSVLFLYLIAIKLIENYKGKVYNNLMDALATFISAAVGALSLGFSDTFWFNAVEAEVYALSTFFIAFVVWLLVKWNENADEPDNEKYLLLIAYLLGLSTGVHLMAVLASVPVAMVVIFRKYLTDEETLKKTGFIFLGHVGLIIVVAMLMWISETDAAAPSQDMFKQIDQKYLLIFIAVSALYMGAFYKKIFQRNSFYIPIVIGGLTLISVYPGMVKYVPKFISTIGGNNVVVDTSVIVIMFALLGFGIYWSKKKDKPTFNFVFKAFFFALLGVTSVAMIIIRANQEPPINMNSPKTFSELESYINREQYGDFPTFKRRFSMEPHQQNIYTNYSSDLDFAWNYQMDHMFNRYLMWNYIGRESTYQDVGVDITKYWAIPFLLALFGVYYQFKKDWKMGAVFLTMFVFLGYLTAFYQNQQEPQPRERDYFYVGAFFVFSIWIALGTRGIYELITESFANKPSVKWMQISVLSLAVILIPVNMLAVNYFEHNRSDNYVPWDYAYNMLQSVAPNSILFTNGDNDTFPLWYLQDVEGVRRDVRVANLSLLNTPWYIKQLKNTSPYGAPKVELSLTDEQIDNIGPERFSPQDMKIPIDAATIKDWGITDSLTTATGYMTWRMNNTIQFGDIRAIRTQDIIVLDMLLNAQWKRPIYYAVTVSDDSKLGLDDYLQMEGMAMRVTPKKLVSRSGMEYIDVDIMRKQFLEEPQGYSKTYQPGFKFRGLNNKNIFYDENHVRLTQNYRNGFIRLALNYINQQQNNQEAIKVLDKMEEKIPRSIIPMDYRIKHDVAKILFSAHANSQYESYAKEVINEAKAKLEANPSDYSSWYNPYDLLLTHYENLRMYDEAIKLLNSLMSIAPHESQNIKMLIQKYENEKAQNTKYLENKNK
ncbi:hypothetical protein APF79_08755 [bacterium BRH_c32]|nr:MAG: hypothetical protein APF79_08755 [bacterium BRH_c32]